MLLSSSRRFSFLYKHRFVFLLKLSWNWKYLDWHGKTQHLILSGKIHNRLLYALLSENSAKVILSETLIVYRTLCITHYWPLWFLNALQNDTVNYQTMISTNTQLSRSPQNLTISTIPDAHRISRWRRRFQFTLVVLSETFIPERFVQPITDRFKFYTSGIGILTLGGPGSDRSSSRGWGKARAGLPRVTAARKLRVFLTAARNSSAAN